MDSLSSIYGATPANGEIARRAEESATPLRAVIASALAHVSPGVRADDIPTTPMQNLANHVMSVFRVNYDFRQSSGQTDRLDYALRANRMEFSAKQKEALARQFGPESDIPSVIHPAATSVKNRGARSILVDLVNQNGEPLFHFEPSPVPDTGDDPKMKAIRAASMRIAAVIAELERNGVTDGNMPPELFARLNEWVQQTTEDYFGYYDSEMQKAESDARDRCRRFERKVWDILEEGGFNEAFTDFITNVCVFGTGVVVGPVMRNVAKNVVKTRGRKRQSKVYRREVRCVPVFESVNPMDCYPAPGAKDVEDGPLCMTVRFTGDELYRYASSAPKEDGFEGGWMGTVVNDILRRHPDGGLKLNAVAFDPDRRVCENNGFDDSSDCMYEGVRCFMPVRGSELAEMGITRNLDNEAIDGRAFYCAEAIVMDNRVVYVCLHADELGVPVSKATFYQSPGSWWGDSIADKLRMSQCILNNTAKSIVLNESMCSSPTGYVTDVSRLVDKSPNGLKFRAGKIFGFTGGNAFGASAPAGAPIGVLPIPSALSDLLATWRAFQQQADLDSGIPAYSEGQSAGASGALRTAEGLNTFVENTMRGMKMVMTDIDKNGISRVARLTADWVLLYDGDQAIKGDVYVRSVGLIGRVLKVKRDAARLQLLNLMLNSQVLTQLIGAKGIVEMFRPSLVDLDINPDDVIPSKERMKEQDLIMQIAQLSQATAAQQKALPQGAPEEGQGGGMQSGIAPIQEPQGAVEERRGVA